MVKVINTYKPKEINSTYTTTIADILNQLITRKKIIVDPGKNTVKILVLNELNEIECFHAFPSKLEAVRNFASDTPKEGQFFIKIKNGRELPSLDGETTHYLDAYYVLGDGTKRGSVETSAEKNTFHHRLCIYTAIHQFVKDGEEVDIVIGYPTKFYGNEDLRKSYIDGVLKAEKVMNIKGDEPVPPGTITLEVNNVVKTFHIREVDVFQEGLGFLTIRANQSKAKQEVAQSKRKKNNEPKTPEVLKTIFIDIGGFNINLHERTGNVYTDHTSLDKVGINILHAELIDAFRDSIKDGEILNKIDTIDWNEVIRTAKIFGESQIGGLDVYLFLLDTIDGFIRKYVIEQIDSKFYINILDDKQISLVFLGGGSLCLQRYLESIFKEKLKQGLVSFSPVPLWDNVLTYAYLYFNKKRRFVDRSKTQLDNDDIALLSHIKSTHDSLVDDGSNPDFIQNHLYKSIQDTIYNTFDVE